MKDFFHEKNKEKNYEEKEAEIMIKMSEDTQSVLDKLNGMAHGTNEDGMVELEMILNKNAKNGKIDRNAFHDVVQSLGIEFTKDHLSRIFKDLSAKQIKYDDRWMTVEFMLCQIKIIVPMRNHLSAMQILYMALLTMNQRKQRNFSIDSDSEASPMIGFGDRGKLDSFDIETEL